MTYRHAVGLLALSLSVVSVAARSAEVSLPDPLAAGWKGQPVCEKLHEDADHRILRCTFPPAAGHERHFHGKHFGYALSGGRMRITDADGTREIDIEPGSSFASDGVAWHEGLNVGDTTLLYLLIEPK